MSKTISDMAFSEILPSSIAGDAKIQGLAEGAGSALMDVAAAVPAVLILSRIDDLPEAVLDLLGWQFHVDFWDPEAALEQKRALVKTSIQVHRIKGTPGAIELMLKAGFDLEADVLEWWQYGGDPFYFRVSIDGGEITPTTQQKILSAINVVKNTRSWLDRLILHQTAAVEVDIAGGTVGILENAALAIRDVESVAPGVIEPAAGTMGGVENTALINLEMELITLCSLYPAGGAVGSVEGFAVTI